MVGEYGHPQQRKRFALSLARLFFFGRETKTGTRRVGEISNFNGLSLKSVEVVGFHNMFLVFGS